MSNEPILGDIVAMAREHPIWDKEPAFTIQEAASYALKWQTPAAFRMLQAIVEREAQFRCMVRALGEHEKNLRQTKQVVDRNSEHIRKLKEELTYWKERAIGESCPPWDWSEAARDEAIQAWVDGDLAGPAPEVVEQALKRGLFPHIILDPLHVGSISCITCNTTVSPTCGDVEFITAFVDAHRHPEVIRE